MTAFSHSSIPHMQQMMILLMHVDKLDMISSETDASGLEPISVSPIEWCTRNTGHDSDHVILIKNCDRLVTDILPEFGFAPISPESFVRKMHRWGFRQVSSAYQAIQNSASNQCSSKLMFESTFFRKDNIALLSKMRSITAAQKQRVSTTADPLRRLYNGIDKTKTKTPASTGKGAKDASASRNKHKRHDSVSKTTHMGTATEQGGEDRSPRTSDPAGATRFQRRVRQKTQPTNTSSQECVEQQKLWSQKVAAAADYTMNTVMPTLQMPKVTYPSIRSMSAMLAANDASRMVLPKPVMYLPRHFARAQPLRMTANSTKFLLGHSVPGLLVSANESSCHMGHGSSGRSVGPSCLYAGIQLSNIEARFCTPPHPSPIHCLSGTPVPMNPNVRRLLLELHLIEIEISNAQTAKARISRTKR
jgi:HSF-type DNA-binding